MLKRFETCPWAEFQLNFHGASSFDDLNIFCFSTFLHINVMYLFMLFGSAPKLLSHNVSAQSWENTVSVLAGSEDFTGSVSGPHCLGLGSVSRHHCLGLGSVSGLHCLGLGTPMSRSRLGAPLSRSRKKISTPSL